MVDKKKAVLDEIADSYYRDLLELRSRILRQNHGITQDEYSLLVWDQIVTYFTNVASHMAQGIPEPDFGYVTGRMRELNLAVLNMAVPFFGDRE
jgi:hypothetical protein